MWVREDTVTRNGREKALVWTMTTDVWATATAALLLLVLSQELTLSQALMLLLLASQDKTLLLPLPLLAQSVPAPDPLFAWLFHAVCPF